MPFTRFTQNSIIITLVTVETLQIIVLLATIVTDYTFEYRKDLRVIKSKKDFLIFFIPFFWVMPMLKSIIKYWNNLT